MRLQWKQWPNLNTGSYFLITADVEFLPYRACACQIFGLHVYSLLLHFFYLYDTTWVVDIVILFLNINKTKPLFSVF